MQLSMLVKCLPTMLLLLFATYAMSQADTATISKEIIFVSDTQAPMWVETLFLKANNNRIATKKIFSDIANRHPAGVYILGDVVSLGYSNRQWKPMDIFLDALRTKGTKVYAVLGNHEVLWCAKSGQRKFQQRFPDHIKTGYLNISDSIAMVLLNANFNKLSEAENAAQIAWYKHTLDSLDADPSILFIITGCHQSPYTNSKIVGSSKAVQQNFVSPFLVSKKSCLFLSGHSHNFEHFRQKGKNFLVIGGGGGLHQPLLEGKDALPDLSPTYKPMFHYLSLHRYGSALQLTSVFLKPDFTGFEEGEKLSVALSSATQTVEVGQPQ